MLTHWLTLRQAEEALKNGRLEEAYRLACQPDVQGHRRAGEIMQELARSLLARAKLHLQHGDNAAAWKDLVQAEAVGPQDQAAVKLRQDLVQRSLNELRSLLESGEPARAAELTQQLRDWNVQQPELHGLADIAQNWSLVQELAARGDFAQAVAVLDRVKRIAAGRYQLLDEFHQDVTRRRAELEPILAQLHRALEQTNWREVLQFADQVLAVAPQHGEARKARARAWKAVEPPTMALPGSGKPAKQSPTPEDTPRRMLLWIDGVGGFLVCLSSRVSFGQATPDAYVDIPFYADISRLHGYLTRDEEGYVLEALRPVTVNHRQVERALLRDGDRVKVADRCELRFRQPVPVSATARLELASGHRLPLSVDGVVLMAETCVLGPGGDAHIVVPDLRRSVVLFRRKDGLGVRATGEMTVDGQKCCDRANLGPHSTVASDDFRFTLEPLGARMAGTRV